MNKDEVNSFLNLKPEEAIEGSSGTPFIPSDESTDPDFYDDESGEDSSFPDSKPADSDSNGDKNTTRVEEKPSSSAMKMTFGICLLFSYVL